MSSVAYRLASLALVVLASSSAACVQSTEDGVVEEGLVAEDSTAEAEQAVVDASDYFRIVSKQVRISDGASLCLEPLDNVSGAPVLQKKCTNAGLSDSNPQAFFKHPTLGNRLAYALKDKNEGTDLCIHMAGLQSYSNGVAAVLYKCDMTRESQNVYASTPDAEGYTSFMMGLSHRCVTVFGSSSADLALVYQYDLYKVSGNCANLAQRWKLQKATSTFTWPQVAPENWPTPAYCQGIPGVAGCVP